MTARKSNNRKRAEDNSLYEKLSGSDKLSRAWQDEVGRQPTQEEISEVTAHIEGRMNEFSDLDSAALTAYQLASDDVDPDTFEDLAAEEVREVARQAREKEERRDERRRNWWNRGLTALIVAMSVGAGIGVYKGSKQVTESALGTHYEQVVQSQEETRRELQQEFEERKAELAADYRQKKQALYSSINGELPALSQTGQSSIDQVTRELYMDAHFPDADFTEKKREDMLTKRTDSYQVFSETVDNAAVTAYGLDFGEASPVSESPDVLVLETKDKDGRTNLLQVMQGGLTIESENGKAELEGINFANLDIRAAAQFTKQGYKTVDFTNQQFTRYQNGDVAYQGTIPTAEREAHRSIQNEFQDLYQRAQKISE